MPKLTQHPGVSIVHPAPGTPYELSWKHPLLNRKQVKRSVKTTDGAKATEYAKVLSRVLRAPEAWAARPDYCPPELWSVWRGEASGDDILAAAATEALAQSRVVLPDAGLDELLSALEVVKAKQGSDTITLADAIAERARKTAIENADLKRQLDTAKGLLKRLGHEAAADYHAKTVIQAVADYLSDDRTISGTNAGARRKQNLLKPWLTRFANEFPPTKMVHEVTATEVIEHLAALMNGEYVKVPEGCKDPAGYRATNRPIAESVETAGEVINKFLVHQTRGMFRKLEVREWLARNCGGEDEETENPYWLEQADLDKLVRYLPDFWAGVAKMQWAGAFRPEELPHLQAAKVFINAQCRVEVARIVDPASHVIIWKPKTKQSAGMVHILDAYLPTAKELAARGRFLLFPNDPALHGGSKTRYGTTPAEKFRAAHAFWNVDRFCEAYRTALRAAAGKAGLEVTRIDSRTLRRSAGKRILLASNCNLELTAACLRDHPETVRKHYARLLPDDVKQPS